MPLRSARLTGDPVLEECLTGGHRMLDGEDGLPVMRVQSGLLDLGRSVGPAGADGIFGPDTGAAVTVYKTQKGLVPNDPVVGPGTIRALDDDLFHDPPGLDPTFWDRNGHGAGINAQGDVVRAHQLDLWLRLCANQSFSAIPAENEQSRLAFLAAARFWEEEPAHPDFDFAEDDGLYPLYHDFR